MLIRNLLFDIGILPSVSYPKAVISVGNLSLGGTGKTPHVEYLIRLISPYFNVSSLSRGYGRNSRGFLLGSTGSQAKDIGDEALQILRKFPQIRVAVDENRRRGIEQLIAAFPMLQVILLDDAFQHRYVKPGLSILLTPYYKPYSEDYPVPSGWLREFRTGARRANIIIVTKTPKIFSPISRRRITEELSLKPWQQLFFSYFSYGDPLPLFQGVTPEYPSKILTILLLTGIADNSQLKEKLERSCSDIKELRFRDHHQFTQKDISGIETAFNDIPTLKKVIITTEKDAMRLCSQDLQPLLKHLPIYYIPIEVEFHGKDGEEFDHSVIGHIQNCKSPS
jgi:tetraacyldisaccharide 4'-kinase